MGTVANLKARFHCFASLVSTQLYPDFIRWDEMVSRQPVEPSPERVQRFKRVSTVF